MSSQYEKFHKAARHQSIVSMLHSQASRLAAPGRVDRTERVIPKVTTRADLMTGLLGSNAPPEPRKTSISPEMMQDSTSG
jgi:hypothetical protein